MSPVFSALLYPHTGPTEVNRMYAHSGTSHGYAGTTDAELIEGFPQPTIYESVGQPLLLKCGPLVCRVDMH